MYTFKKQAYHPFTPTKSYFFNSDIETKAFVKSEISAHTNEHTDNYNSAPKLHGFSTWIYTRRCCLTLAMCQPGHHVGLGNPCLNACMRLEAGVYPQIKSL